MSGYDQKIKVKSIYEAEAKNFLGFLKNVGAQSTRYVNINHSYLGRGYFRISVRDRAENIDLLLQELFLNKGLYYYSCTLSKRQIIVSNVILPILQQIIDSRFSNPQSRFIRKHILGKHAQSNFIPSDLKNKYGCLFEVLFRKWQLNIISNKDYVIEVDTLLHEYLLNVLEHKEGENSEEFSKLLSKLTLPFELNSDFKTAFLKIHSLRTGVLHRLQSIKATDILDYHSDCIYNYFQFLDEYKESQKEKFYFIRGRAYKRIKFGHERYCVDKKMRGVSINRVDILHESPCHDCFVMRNRYHITGCDVEICPKCKGQLISCDCKWDFYKDTE